MTQSIGALIREARKARGLTQEQLASLVHVSRQTVSHWENGRAEPGYDMLKTLAEHLNLDISQLFAEPPSDVAAAQTAEPPACDRPATTEPSMSEAAPVSKKQPGRRQKAVWAACAAALIVLLIAGAAFLLRPAYPLRFFTEQQSVASDQPNVLIYTRNSPIIKKGTGKSGKWEFPIFFKEQNGFGLEVTSLRLVWFRRSGSQYIETLSPEEFIAHTGSATIGPGEIRFINIGKPATFDLVRFGCILTGVDDSGREVVFRMTVPLE